MRKEKQKLSTYKRPTWGLFLGVGLMTLCYWLIYRARRRHDYPTIALASAMKYMKTGDLILFSGRNIAKGEVDQMARRLVFLSATYLYRAFDACEWGHVAVVFREPSTKKLYLLHCEMRGGVPLP